MNKNRPKITYENVALFQTFNSSHKKAFAHNTISNSGSGLSFIPHVQSIDFSFDSNRDSIGSLGNKKLISQGVRYSPDVNLSINTLETFGSFWNNYFEYGDMVRSNLNNDVNIYSFIGNSRGKPVTGESISGRASIGFGNCFLNNISMSQDVNGLLQSQYSFVASDMIAQEVQEKKFTLDSNRDPVGDIITDTTKMFVTGTGTITDELGNRRDNCILLSGISGKDGAAARSFFSVGKMLFQVFGGIETGVNGSANGTEMKFATKGNAKLSFDMYIPTPRSGLGKNANEMYSSSDSTKSPYVNKFPMGIRAFIGGFGLGTLVSGAPLGKSGDDINSIPEDTGYGADAGTRGVLDDPIPGRPLRTGKWFHVSGFHFDHKDDGEGGFDRTSVGKSATYVRDDVGLRFYLVSGKRGPGAEDGIDTDSDGETVGGTVNNNIDGANWNQCIAFIANVSGFVHRSGQYKRFTGMAPSVNLTGGTGGQMDRIPFTMAPMQQYFLNKQQATGEMIPYYNTEIKIKRRNKDIPLSQYKVLNGEEFTGFKPEIPTKLYASFASDYINDGDDDDQGELRILIDDEVVYDCNDTGLGFQPINRGFILARVSTNNGVYKFEEGDIFDTFNGFTGTNGIYSGGGSFHRSILEASGFMQRFNTGDILFAMSSDTPVISHAASKALYSPNKNVGNTSDDPLTTSPSVAIASGLRQPFRDDFGAQFAYKTGSSANAGGGENPTGTSPHRGAYALIAQKGKGVIYEQIYLRTGQQDVPGGQSSPKGCVYLPRENEFLASSDQIQSFNLDIPIGRKSIYSMGNKKAVRRKPLFPNVGTFSLTNRVSDFNTFGNDEDLILNPATTKTVVQGAPVPSNRNMQSLDNFLDSDDEYDISLNMKNQKGEKYEFEIKKARLNGQSYSTSIGSEIFQNASFSFDTQEIKRKKVANKYDSIDHGYSLNKINANYTGFGVRVRRVSDGKQADVFFDKHGKISDESEIEYVDLASAFSFLGDGYEDDRGGQLYGTETIYTPNSALHGESFKARTFKEFLSETYPRSNMDMPEDFGGRLSTYDGLILQNSSLTTGLLGHPTLLMPPPGSGGFDGTGALNDTHGPLANTIAFVKTGGANTPVSELGINLGGACTGDSFVMTLNMRSEFTGKDGGIVSGHLLTGFSAGTTQASGGHGGGSDQASSFDLLNHSATFSIKNGIGMHSGGRAISDFSGFVVPDSGSSSEINRFTFLCTITGSGMATGTSDIFENIFLTAEANHPVAQRISTIGFLQRKTSAQVVTWYDQIGSKNLTGHHHSTQCPIIARGGKVLDYVRFNEHNSNLLNFPMGAPVQPNSIYWVGRFWDQGAADGDTRDTGPDAGSSSSSNINGFLGHESNPVGKQPYIFFTQGTSQTKDIISLDGNFVGGGTGGALSGYFYQNNRDLPEAMTNNANGTIGTGKFFQHTYKYESFSGTTIWNVAKESSNSAAVDGFQTLGLVNPNANNIPYFGTFDIKELLLASGKDAGGAAHRIGIQKDLVERHNIIDDNNQD